ncbi:MAG: PhzF family phenazine biosynthesis protein [Idiomarina sp.]|nr:PhzF family phenazine biosynthesis protein [Idiomarina sp.]
MTEDKAIIYDVFCNDVLFGNPCGVVLLEHWACEDELLRVAQRVAQPVTSFVVISDEGYKVRWFSLSGEINLCGHGSLAAGAAIMSAHDLKQVVLQSEYGNIEVSQKNGLYQIMLPGWKSEPNKATAVLQHLGLTLLDSFATRDMVVVVESETEVRNFQPNFELLKKIESYHAVIVTARSDTDEYVFRYFAPNIGILEDLATGSAHCSLAPYWFDKIGTDKLSARQLSITGGYFEVEKGSVGAISISACVKERPHAGALLGVSP